MVSASLRSDSDDVPPAPRLLDQVRLAALAHFGRNEPGVRYADWVRRFVLFCGKRHPRELGRDAVGSFLRHVGQTEKQDPLRCLEQAHEALTILFREVVHRDLGELPFPEPPRLLDRLRHAMRVRHLAAATEERYDWVAARERPGQAFRGPFFAAATPAAWGDGRRGGEQCWCVARMKGSPRRVIDGGPRPARAVELEAELSPSAPRAGDQRQLGGVCCVGLRAWLDEPECPIRDDPGPRPLDWPTAREPAPTRSPHSAPGHNTLGESKTKTGARLVETPVPFWGKQTIHGCPPAERPTNWDLLTE